MIKQILSLPQNTPDTVPYILSGLIPVEGQLHIKALTFMYSIFLLPKESTENMIAYRQLYIKDYKSSYVGLFEMEENNLEMQLTRYIQVAG